MQWVCLYQALKLGLRKHFRFEKLINVGKYLWLVRKIRGLDDVNFESHCLKREFVVLIIYCNFITSPGSLIAFDLLMHFWWIVDVKIWKSSLISSDPWAYNYSEIARFDTVIIDKLFFNAFFVLVILPVRLITFYFTNVPNSNSKSYS